MLSSILKLYQLSWHTSDSDMQNKPDPTKSSQDKMRALYHFALRGRCSFMQLKPGETLYTEGSERQGVFALAGGQLLASHAGNDVLEYSNVGQLVGARSLFGVSDVTV